MAKAADIIRLKRSVIVESADPKTLESVRVDWETTEGEVTLHQGEVSIWLTGPMVTALALLFSESGGSNG